MSVDGILIVDKPSGMTSFDVVALVRRLSRERKVGHAGTLDPDATGVLPVCLGQGTRVVEFLSEAPKCYRAGIELGVATDTYDAGGKVTSKGDASSITGEQVENALAFFRGPIDQVPPMYSAIKQAGKPLYRLARAGVEVPREPRRVEIFRLEISGWQPPLVTVEVVCSKGTYIRSLAHDLGQKLGCGAHMKSLVRTCLGPFRIEDAVSLPAIEDGFRQGRWRELLKNIDVAVQHLPATYVDEEAEKSVINGMFLQLPSGECDPDRLCRAYSQDGRLIALLRFNPEEGNWHPEKVFGRLPIP